MQVYLWREEGGGLDPAEGRGAGCVLWTVLQVRGDTRWTYLKSAEVFGAGSNGLRVLEQGDRHASLCVSLLWISSCEPVSLAHDRPQPAYILRTGQ